MSYEYDALNYAINEYLENHSFSELLEVIAYRAREREEEGGEK